MAKTMEEIRANRPKAEMSEEHKALRGDVSKDKPYWSEHYTAEEWRTKEWFEKRGSEEDTYSAYVSKLDLSELEI